MNSLISTILGCGGCARFRLRGKLRNLLIIKQYNVCGARAYINIDAAPWGGRPDRMARYLPARRSNFIPLATPFCSPCCIKQISSVTTAEAH